MHQEAPSLPTIESDDERPPHHRMGGAPRPVLQGQAPHHAKSKKSRKAPEPIAPIPGTLLPCTDFSLWDSSV